MSPLLLQLFQVFAPIVGDLIRQHRAANNGALPTDEQVLQQFQANLAAGDAEAAAWRVKHGLA